MQKLVASNPAIEMERLVPESTELGPLTPSGEAGLEPTSGEITPINDGASSITPLSIQDDDPDRPNKDTSLSHRQVAGVAGLFFLFTAAFAASTVLVQSNGNRLTRSDPDLFDPGCIDKLGDSGSPRVTKAFDLDLTFGNFTFTNAKVIDVAWDTAIGQGGRLLHGWILYRCVMHRLLLYAMEYYCVTYRYYLTISWARASWESFWVIIRDLFHTEGVATFLCSVLLIYALGYTLLFPLLWSTATGYVNLSHRLYAMPNGDIVPLNTPDLTLCWVLDGSRFDFPDDHVEVGPDFSALGSLRTNLQERDSKTCISSFHGFGIDGIPMLDPHGLVFTSGGWKADTATTIWDHFELINGSNNIGQTSDNFQSIRSYALTKQLLQISIHPQGWASTEDSGFDWWANATGYCPFSNFSGLSTTLDAAQYEPIQATPNPAGLQQVLEFGVPEYISRARFALGNMSGEAFAPGELPYNSTMWLNGSAISLPAPFVDVGHGCRGNSGFGSLGNCVCYKGAPISLDLLGEGRAICNTAPGYVWGFSSFLVKSGLGLEAGWMACCLICYWYLSLRSGLVRKKMMRTAGAMRFSLESSEAVCELEKSAPELSEDGLKARLKSANVGYRPAGTSALEKHGGLRYRVVAGLGREERVEREAGVMDIADRKINEFGGWMKETWRQRKPTDAEVYEDINWDMYQRRRL